MNDIQCADTTAQKDKKLDGTNLVGDAMLELSRFMRTDVYPFEDSEPIRFLASSGTKVLLATNEKGEQILFTHRGTCKTLAGKTEIVSFRYAIMAFCAHGQNGERTPDRFIPVLEAGIERLRKEHAGA
ncbi:MAG: hypothetical protein Q7R88_01715 [bacterium]|nr:hypothetical protein [bacterium]